VVDQLAELLVTDLTLPDLSGEIDMVENSFKRNVLGFNAAKRLIELVANVFMSFINEISEARLRGYPECPCLSVLDLILGTLRSLLFRYAILHSLFNDVVSRLIEHIRAPFQEKHSKDVFLEFRRIHLSAKNVGCAE